MRTDRAPDTIMLCCNVAQRVHSRVKNPPDESPRPNYETALRAQSERKAQAMTYAELKTWIETFTAVQLESDVTVYTNNFGDYKPVTGFDFSVGSDVIDDDCPILEIQ